MREFKVYVTERRYLGAFKATSTTLAEEKAEEHYAAFPSLADEPEVVCFEAEEV